MPVPVVSVVAMFTGGHIRVLLCFAGLKAVRLLLVDSLIGGRLVAHDALTADFACTHDSVNR